MLSVFPARHEFSLELVCRENTVSVPRLSNRTIESDLLDVKFTCSHVEKILLGLHVDKSPEPDTIHPRVMKECASELSYPLFVLFRKSIESGYTPKN